LFTGLDKSRAQKALTVLARAALSYSEARPLLARALAADFEHLAIPALAVAVETNSMVDRVLAATIAAQTIPAQTLQRIAAAIPRGSPALAETSITILHRLAHQSPEGSAERVSRLNDLSARLTDLGREEEARAVIEQAVAIWRGLAETRSDALPPNLATSLGDRSQREGDQWERRAEPK
jgi:hypothetical protein